jgi:hypothetical protein
MYRHWIKAKQSRVKVSVCANGTGGETPSIPTPGMIYGVNLDLRGLIGEEESLALVKHIFLYIKSRRFSTTEGKK